jgi:DNA excision repair protein ERCC-2
MIKREILFPHDKVRKIQDEMISDVVNATKNRKNLIVHAPTGIGKTASVLGPALSCALENDLTVFFLTSRHTQHKIAIDTLKQIRKKYKRDFGVVDMLGKKWMCLQGGAERLYSNDFADYCKRLRESKECEFCLNVRRNTKLSVGAKKVLKELRFKPLHAEELIEICGKEKLCPYEISALLCKEARVVVGDYYYIFNGNIRENLFKRAEKELCKCIIIVDEGHNLPMRIRNLATVRLSNVSIEKAIKEAKKYGYNDAIEALGLIGNALKGVAEGLGIGEERLVEKNGFTEKVGNAVDYEGVLNELILIGDEVRAKQKQSFIGSIGSFLEAWRGPDEGFARIVSCNEGARQKMIVLSYRCLDPSLITKDTIEQSYSTIIMSGTLTPTFMYRDILGVDNAVEKAYSSPFPKKNMLNLIVPETTTKFTRRNEKEYEKIGRLCAEIANLVPGNCLLFFPSYCLRDSIYKHFFKLCEKTIFLEKPNLSKKEKSEIIERFKSYKDRGAVLLAAATGSFGEGIDLPGDFLKAVIVVGLPLEKPSLEVKELIRYYDEKFSRGWDYGYVFPAIIRCLQNAGRCIRSETDKGVIIFLDERFAWQNYYRCFPPETDIKITRLYKERIKNFFVLA